MDEFDKSKRNIRSASRLGTRRPESRWVCDSQSCAAANTMNFRYCRSCGNPRPDTPPPLQDEDSSDSETESWTYASLSRKKTNIMDFNLRRRLRPDTPRYSSESQSQASTLGQRLARLSFSSRQADLPVPSSTDTPMTATPSNAHITSWPCDKIRSIKIEKLKHDQEEKAKDESRKFEDYCKEAKEPFVADKNFPPAPSSLYYPETLTRPPVQWLRPQNIRTDDNRKGWTVFCAGGPKYTDIELGSTNTYESDWLFLALSVLVERPDLLRKIFLTSEYNPFGFYMLRLCKDGQWKTVVVDDFLPCNKNCELLNAQAIRNQLWVPLIEKALAKMNGCYEALNRGRCVEALAVFTGAPCETVQLMPTNDQTDFDPDIVWTVLLTSKNAGFLMGASCGRRNMVINEEVFDRVHLQINVWYGILDVREEKADDGSMVKLLQLHHLWPRGSWWSGDWSDVSCKWSDNPQLRYRLNSAKCGRGIFWICFTDMLKYFSSVDICKLRGADWEETRFQGAFPDSSLHPPPSYFLEVFQPTEIDLAIFQEDPRCEEGSQRHPVDLTVCVFRSPEETASARPHSDVPLGPLVACSRRRVSCREPCFHFFEPGVYQVVALAFNHWLSGFGATPTLNTSDHPKLHLALHSSEAIQLTKFTSISTLFSEATIELVMKRGEQKEVRECASCYYLTRGWGGLIVVAENRHPDRYLHVVCDCEESNNVVSTRGHFITRDSIPPLHKQVLILLTQLDGWSGFTITHKLAHRMSSKGLADWSNVGRPENEHEPALSGDVVALHGPRPM